ncbi:MAG: sigma-70 family RNA polymerase sigma factor [Planctomycetes bacterium]|nr:sigma-70 family RNA polymerase sigma factor [Planctomycetota bacterium]
MVPTPPSALTTVIVRDAVAGRPDAIQAICEKFTPALMVCARRHLKGGLADHYEPADLVQDVWIRVLPRLPDINERDGRVTPVLMRFFATTLKNHYCNLLSKHIKGKPKQIGSGGDAGGNSPLDQVSATITRVASRLVRDEKNEVLYATIDELDERDREVIILRGLEQMSHDQVAQVTGESESAVRNRYSRARQKLLARLPGSLFAELD